jgi:ribonuclease BN (tRNA processing enzyme)
MKVTILGAGTSVPARGRSPAGILVQASGERLLLDAGPGTLQRLHRAGVTFLDVDRLFLTHFHVDHCLDLVSLLFAMRLPAPPSGPSPARTKPFTVYGPKGLKLLYRQLNTAYQRWLEPKSYRLTLKELGEATIRLGRMTVTTRRMAHASGQALGYRLEAGGKSLAYSGDTDVCPEIVALGRRADALILECSTTDERKVAGHLTPSDCGRIAREAGCRRLVLTHFYPVFDGYDLRGRVRRFFRGPLTLARDFTTLHV